MNQKDQLNVPKALSLKEIEIKGETEREIEKKLKNTPYVSLQTLHHSNSEKKLSIRELVSSPENYIYEINRPKIFQESGFDDSSKFEFNFFKLSRTPSQTTIGFNNNGNRSHFGIKTLIQ